MEISAVDREIELIIKEKKREIKENILIDNTLD
jgi:hypothetical protein